MLGVLFTAYSAIRSNKYLMYALAAVVFLGALFLALNRFGNQREKEGAMKIASVAAKAVIKNMEKSREIHAEIKRLPLSARAAKLRATDRRTDRSD